MKQHNLHPSFIWPAQKLRAAPFGGVPGDEIRWNNECHGNHLQRKYLDFFVHLHFHLPFCLPIGQQFKRTKHRKPGPHTCSHSAGPPPRASAWPASQLLPVESGPDKLLPRKHKKRKKPRSVLCGFPGNLLLSSLAKHRLVRG